ncbi:MAG: hypothetical protein P9F19_18500 [Candidatus Contendobacter sp.]|nr:hypothetical protein [Candidatus Contendobacter sp.]MDG4559359.1 hypothetical protein [Candidatus Contendobacter sp.]
MMIADRRTLDSLRAGACQARVVGDYARAARLERQAVERAEALGWIDERTRALLWEGYSLRQAGEDDLALAALLQAASERAATADPADVFSALIAIVHISLDHKSVAFCRVVLDQGRRLLADLRRPWSGPLDFLEGELALRRGDFTAAWSWHSRAWVGWRDEHPRLTAPTHLWALCRVAFRRRATDELARLTETLAELRPAQALERQLVQRARLLDWRARRALALGDAAPVEPALDLLAATEKGEGGGPDFGARREALRVLALAGHWEEMDAALSRWPLDLERFEDALLLGDLALGRARAARGGPAVDEDYGEPANGGSASSFVLTGEALREAESYYRVALSLAEIEDERLETEWHGATVRERLWRI